MDLQIYYQTWKEYGGHDLLSLIAFFLELEDQDFGPAIQEIHVTVNFKPKSHLMQVYDQENDLMKEAPDYVIRRQKKIVEIIYLSKVSTQEEESYPHQLTNTKFNELCFELRHYLKGIEVLLKKSTQFDLESFLLYIDKKLKVLPYTTEQLLFLKDQYDLERELPPSESWEQKQAYKRASLEELWSKTENDPFNFLPIEEVCWQFGDRVFDDIDTFEKELNIYCWEVSNHDTRIHNREICHTNKFLLRFIGVTPGEDSYSDFEVELQGNNPESLTFLEFLLLANNATYEYLRNADHIYYEGFAELDDVGGTPVFELIQGS